MLATESPSQEICHFVESWMQAEIPLKITKLENGLSHSSYLISKGDEKYVLKIANPEAPLSTVLKEFWISQLASEQNIGPKVLAINLEQKVVLMEYLSSREPIKEDSFKIVDRLKELHHTLENEPFSTLYDRFKIILINGDERWKKALSYVRAIDQSIKASDVGKTLCHLDFHKYNVLVCEEKVYLIDWSSSGFGHPFYDLAKFFHEYPQKEQQDYLKHYLLRDPSTEDKTAYRLMQYIVKICIATNRYLRQEFDKADESINSFLEFIEKDEFFIKMEN